MLRRYKKDVVLLWYFNHVTDMEEWNVGMLEYWE